MVLGGGVFGRWLRHEDGARVNGVSALGEESQSCSSPLLSATGGHSEK